MQNKYKIGIIGGGQLGKMMTQAAKKLGFHVTILDPTQHSPAGQVADIEITGHFKDPEKLHHIVESCDVTTYDIEHIETGILTELSKKHTIYPSHKILTLIQDKSLQKEAFYRHAIPCARFLKGSTPLSEVMKHFSFPLVQKMNQGGYDGRGVFVAKTEAELKPIPQDQFFYEEFIPFEKELAMLIARNPQGEIRTYPLVEMHFDPRANICDLVIAPARVSKELERKAVLIAIHCMDVFQGVGVFGIEMFLTKTGEVLVNEIAPRPHNSGHYTIEACITSQFEQHIRAVTGLPLGSTELLIPAVMMNLLGEPGHEGPPEFQGIQEALKIEGLSMHLYGKKITSPFRKMGHLTIVDKNLDHALLKASLAKTFLKVLAKP
jgi:5-(carboxyamino)imidazole ribonucleotide synthase